MDQWRWRYSLAYVPAGADTLAATAAGFKLYEHSHLVIETAQASVIDIRLELGSQTDKVTGSGILVNTTDAAVSTIIDRRFVENIPLNGRSFQSLLTTVPGVIAVPSQGTGIGGELSVNGQRTESNYFTVNGISMNTGAIPSTPGFGAGYSGSLPGQTAFGTTQSLASLDELQWNFTPEQAIGPNQKVSAGYVASARSTVGFSTTAQPGVVLLQFRAYDRVTGHSSVTRSWKSGPPYSAGILSSAYSRQGNGRFGKFNHQVRRSIKAFRNHRGDTSTFVRFSELLSSPEANFEHQGGKIRIVRLQRSGCV